MIYITQEKKQELEDLLELLKNSSPLDREEGQYIEGKISMLESILDDIVLLPVEESWKEALSKAGELKAKHVIETNGEFNEGLHEFAFPQGVIIKPK